ncbi:hypothetical protein [Bradyrhizobium sp.]|uniref:hypothetical protein n=1 Tax=Bradyrhizobium sp. TaxID=376 RepID=UPI0026321871|nr:hypothetical protein [Bradyrhizobium sp.]
MVDGDTESQGKLLRAALVEHVRTSISSGKTQRVGTGKHIRVNVDDVINQFSLEGSTFDYAEKVLRAAEFVVDPRPTPEAPGFVGGEYAFDVNAMAKLDGVNGVKCVIALRPAAPYDYGRVSRVLTDCGLIWSPIPPLPRWLARRPDWRMVLVAFIGIVAVCICLSILLSWAR